MLPDGAYQVARRPHAWSRDAHGTPVPATLGSYGTARPGGAYDRGDGLWSLRLDPAEWPLYDGDKITDGARTWTVVSAPILRANSDADDVDYVAVTATLDPPVVP